MSHSGLPVFVVLATLLFAGCGPAGPRPHPVSGQVKYKGKALPGAVLAFHPVGARAGERAITAVTDDEGRFTLTYHKPGNGAPPGEYAVTVVWRELRRDGDEVLRNGRNLLPGKYERPGTSGLLVTVAEGPNELRPFDLTP
jgi:hypothetical protein